MPIPKNVTWVTFDVYGTLIDWESGIYDAFSAEAAKDGVEIDRDQLIAHFHEVSREIEAGSYELYAEVLRRVVVRLPSGWTGLWYLHARAFSRSRSRGGNRSGKRTRS